MTFSKWSIAFCAVGIVGTTLGLDGQSFSTYRQFELGGDLAAVSSAAGVPVSTATVVHQRPAVLQELEWRPSRWTTGAITPSRDPVEHITFSFYNDQLFRIIVDYRTEGTEGMTAPDLIEGVSAVYGTPISQTVRNRNRAMSRAEVESGSPIARWGDTDHTVVLYRTSSLSQAFRLILTDEPRGKLAEQADTEARRLDDREAPQRERDQEKSALEAERKAAAKARLANKGAFQP